MSNIIDSIRMSGTTYAISDSGGTKVVEITQNDYDNLPTSAKTANIMYVITDAEPFDVSNYYTKAETSGATELATAFAATQSKLSAGTNITIDANNVISASGGGIDSGTVQTMIDQSISGKTNQTDFVSHSGNTTMHVTASEKSTWNAKSDFSGNYNDLSNKPTIPTSASQLTNDSGYITSSALNGYATEAYVTAATNDMATKTWVGQQGYLTQHQDISGKQDVSGMTAYTETSAFTAHTADTTVHVTANEKSAWNAKSDFSGSYNDLTDKPTLFSGSYNDLTDKPTIPSKTSDLTNDSNFATSAYVDTKLSISDFNTYSGTVNTAIGNKANSSDVYTKSQTSGATEISTALNAKLDTTAYTPTDLSNYYQKSETSGATQIADALSGKVDSSSVVTAVTSASTDNEIPTAKAVYDAIPTGGTGGGKAISAGTNISVTTGETADTINCTLPIKTNAWNSLTFNSSRNPLQVLYASAFGDYTTASGKGSFSIGKDTTASGDYSFVGGYNYSQAKGNESFSFGDGTVANKNASVAFGRNITTNNECEFSCGKLNKSVSASTTFGNSGNTLFSVGNGISSYHNAFEIRQNGDIYLNNGTSDVKIQDYLQIKVVKLTQSTYNALSPNYDSNTLYIIKD